MSLLLNSLASARFWGLSEKKTPKRTWLCAGFLRSGMLYRPGKSLKRCGKSSSLHSKKIFCLGDAVFCEWRHKWRTFRPPWPTLPGPGRQPLGGSVATSPVVLRWLCDSPRTGCAWRTTPLYMWHKQAIVREIASMISIVACCHGAKLCAYAARDFRSQQNGAVTWMWRSCWVQPSHKERAISAVHCKKEGMLLQPLQWCCVECVIHHERDVRQEQHYYICGASKQ